MFKEETETVVYQTKEVTVPARKPDEGKPQRIEISQEKGR